MNVGYFENVFVALVSNMHYTCFTLSSVACPALSYFSHYLIKGKIFEKKVTRYNIRVLTFSTTMSETFLIPRSILFHNAYSQKWK